MTEAWFLAGWIRMWHRHNPVFDPTGYVPWFIMPGDWLADRVIPYTALTFPG